MSSRRPTSSSSKSDALPPARMGWNVIKLWPALSFMVLVIIHETLSLIVATRWYDFEKFAELQAIWYSVWEAGLMLFFVWNHLRVGKSIGTGRLLFFWAVQAAWFALGLWCFGVWLGNQPFAIQGVAGWLVGAFVLAVIAEDLGKPSVVKSDDSYFTALFQRKMPE